MKRVVAILDFMAEHPGQSFTLTDILSTLKLSRATCHALLAGLVEANYLYRTNDKRYVLGQRLAAIGRTADEHFSPLRAAQPEMRALADEFDAVCSAVFREGGEIVVRERSASRSHLGWSVARGTRLPLRPPVGSIFMAWSSPAKLAAFIDTIVPEPSAEYKKELSAGAEFTRNVGFQTALRAFDDAFFEGEPSVDWLLATPTANPPFRVATMLEPEKSYPLASITAPVFDARSQIEFVLGLMGFTGERKGAEIVVMGQKLREACDRVTDFLGGSKP